MKPFAFIVLVAGSSCFSLRYVSQAAAGQYQLVHEARSLAATREDESLSPAVRALVSHVPALKRFAELQGLTPTSNYTDYVQLRRSAVVWVVQASPEFSLEPKRWHFPIAGSVPYLGFFHEEDAREFANELRKQPGLDVTVRTASAYSTLGWLRDPVLSTMIPEGPTAFASLANTIFHESVHASVYVPNQSAFNESMASFVADGLTWDLVVGLHGLHSQPTQTLRKHNERAAQFASEMHRTAEALQSLYASGLHPEEMRRRKSLLLVELQHKLGLRRAYNNADLSGNRTYDTGRDAFEWLRRQCGTWPRFMAAVRSVKKTDFTQRQQTHFESLVETLRQRHCPP